MTLPPEIYGFRVSGEPETDERGYVSVIGTPWGRARYMMVDPRRGGRRQLDTVRRGDRLRWHRRRQVDRTRVVGAFAFIQYECEIREIEALMDQMAADGEIIKNPDGTYQAKPPTLADNLAARRERARGDWAS